MPPKSQVTTSVWRLLAVLLLALFMLTACDVQGNGGANSSTPGATLATEAPEGMNLATPTQVAPVTAAAMSTESATTPMVEATTTPELPATEEALAFDGERAFEYLEAQMAFGPRWPGSPGHEAVGNYIVEELQTLGWVVEEQLFDYQRVQGRNIIGRANVSEELIYIVGAHYDTRRVADQTPEAVEEQLPVPGAVDGASGVAVLLELARTLDLDETPGQVWLAFFDMEDNGSDGIPGWDWIIGSTYMAANLETLPEAMVLVDMIGDADQQLYYEGNSDAELREELWAIADMLGYGDAFIPELRYTMIDDHVPFASRGIPAVDIIDFDYPYWHTVEDTVDKASAESLERVGRTVEYWLETELE